MDGVAAIFDRRDETQILEAVLMSSVGTTTTTRSAAVFLRALCYSSGK
jgi:hypothetical protein